MKKLFALLLVAGMCFSLAACGGNVKDVQIKEYSSEIYTDAEIEDAIDVAINYFKKEFSGCTLTEITYIGDDKLDAYEEFAQRHNAADVIVLVSSFDVDSSCGDGSLNPDSTYTDWNWILVRNDGGKWTHVDHGY